MLTEFLTLGQVNTFVSHVYIILQMGKVRPRRVSNLPDITLLVSGWARYLEL